MQSAPLPSNKMNRIVVHPVAPVRRCLLGWKLLTSNGLGARNSLARIPGIPRHVGPLRAMEEPETSGSEEGMELPPTDQLMVLDEFLPEDEANR